ncbi:MAG: hypothetical protein IPM37_15720 [Hahellaceae bacterium]|nr:hypothetical protein [Hahellaceae bacterium]
MAIRPVFVATINGDTLVRSFDVEFEWHPGFAISQKRKSIEGLHEAAFKQAVANRLLEVSSKSLTSEGEALSAFNLKLKDDSGRIRTVECLFQGSKVFLQGGPFPDLYDVEPLQAKRDPRLQSHGRLTGFYYQGFMWPNVPTSAFYDWLYLNALRQNPVLSEFVMGFDGFTDIEFNPAKSLNCQAASVALYQSLVRRGQLDQALESPAAFLDCLQNRSLRDKAQGALFD